MTIAEKLKWVVLPSLIVIGIGILEIKYPHAFQGFDDNYTGRGMAGFIMLLIELFIMLTWGTIEGIVLIVLGILPIVICFFPFKDQVNESEENEKLRDVVAVSAFSVGKAYVKRRRRNRQA
jgi:heme/copper-type cytochrome/quinol oxidase subunit 2